jgi:hypothetical protein
LAAVVVQSAQDCEPKRVPVLVVSDQKWSVVKFTPVPLSQYAFRVDPDVKSLQLLATKDPSTCLYAMFVKCVKSFDGDNWLGWATTDIHAL